MHGGLLIFLWLAAVALMQRLPPIWLGVLLVLLGLACMVVARPRVFRLMRRIRILLLAIIVLFAWFTPGTRLIVDWPSISPTVEGLTLAFEHACRVVAVVFCVALLMHYLAASRLVGAIYALLRPFESLGLPAGRIAVRTLLVLELVENKTSGGWKQWLTPNREETLIEPVLMPVERLRVRDWVIFVAGMATIVSLWVAL